jgi:predicted AAA+ superfamily ATPase
MKIYPRAIRKKFENGLRPNKVLMLLGPRRSGKTAFIKEYLKSIDESEYLFLNGDDILDIQILSERSILNYKRILGEKSLLVIDEAQHIPEMGKILKLMVDNIDGLRIIASGSSAFDIYHQVGEPLVGRKVTLHLYPLAQMEFSKVEDYKTTLFKKEERLIFGSYPELEQYTDWGQKEEYLYEIVNDYLLRDILIIDGLRNSDKLYSLLRLIAFQIGKEVSIEELGKQLGMSKNTVEKYLDLLSKVFVVKKVGGWSRNLRKEVTKTSRWYFYDNGIRNAILKNFNKLKLRADTGDLWENYLVSERLKFQEYHSIRCNNYFWRTYDQQELDWVEEQGENLRGYEFKFKLSKQPKIPTAWKKAYPNAGFEVIHSENYLEWIT